MSINGGIDPAGRVRDQAVTFGGDAFVTSRVFKTQRIQVPGIGTAAAYTAADAFGTSFIIAVPPEGTISNVVFIDLDDEGLPKELILFDLPFTPTADNAAFAVTDADMLNCIGVIEIASFYNFSVNQIGVALPALAYSAPRGSLYAQFVTRGADNIAVGAIPEFFMVIV